MVKVINNIKDVKTRTKKASFGQTMSNIFHKVKTGLRKGAEWVMNRAMPWIRNTALPAIKRGIQKAPELINRISNTISAATGATGKIGKIIGGKFGRKLEEGSDRAEQKHQEIRQRVENAYKKGEEIVREGKDAYNQARQAIDKEVVWNVYRKLSKYDYLYVHYCPECPEIYICTQDGKKRLLLEEEQEYLS